MILDLDFDFSLLSFPSSWLTIILAMALGQGLTTLKTILRGRYYFIIIPIFQMRKLRTGNAKKFTSSYNR